MLQRDASSLPRRGRFRGFTLIELVMVMLIVSALAVFALPRVLDVTTFRLASYADRIQNATTFANRLALAQRRPVVVTFATTGVSIAYGSGGAINLPVADPSTGSAMSLTCPAGTSPCLTAGSAGSVTFNVNNTGTSQTPSSAPFQITVTGTGFTQNFTIEPVSGLVRKT
jgi:prepilin-type N-terminal cleavage/methylation domain-containing protein